MKKVNKHEEKLQAILLAYFGTDRIEREYRFHIPKVNEKQRKWRFDFAVPSFKLAFEVEGGVWTGGRHVNPMGYTKDCEKYNKATQQGWKVFRFVPTMINEEYLEELFSEKDHD